MRNFLNLRLIQKKLSHQWRICQFSVPDQRYITKPAKLLWDWKQTVSPSPNQKTFTVSSVSRYVSLLNETITKSGHNSEMDSVLCICNVPGSIPGKMGGKKILA